MMYKNNVAVVIKANGKVLREHQGAVLLPFGSEYSVLVKNLNSVRIKFRLSVDGEDSLDNRWIIVGPNSSTEIERFIRNGNLEDGNKFKFIERSAAVEAHRGVKAEDGLVRVEFETEKIFHPVNWNYESVVHSFIPPSRGFIGGNWTGCSGGALRSSGAHSGIGGSSVHVANMAVATNCSVQSSQPIAEESGAAGITAPGSHSDQKFVNGSWFYTEPGSTVIVLQLQGIAAGRAVPAPVTVQAKPSCSSCGKTNKATSNFCNQCGTALSLY